MNNLFRHFYILITIIFIAALFGCTRNPLGEQIFQPIASAGFLITHTCSRSLTQDSAYSCTLVVSDTSAPVTWALSGTSTCSWASINPISGTITGTPLDAHVGTCNLVVGASQANKVAQPITITLSIANIAPVLTIANAASITEDAVATLIRTDADVQASEEGDGIYYFDHATTTVPRCSDNAQSLTINAMTGAITFNPAADYSGTCNIKAVFNDQTGAADAAVGAEFSITVNPVNDQPVLSAIANQAASENTPVVVNFTFSDVDNTVTCSTANLTFASSNSGLIDPSNISFSGAVPNCTATINPTAAQTGVATLTLTGSDGSLSAVRTFTVTITQVNDAPVISAVGSQTAPEDTVINVPFTINDPDNILTCTTANLSATSSDLTLMPLANIVFSGTVPNCVATFTPVANANGASNIQITVNDNGTPNLQASTSFTLTVTAVNDVPTISNIADQTVGEDAATAALAFTINDVDSTVSCATSVTASSSNTTVIPTANVVVAGTAPNCTVTVTPAANQAGGPIQITLTLTDSGTPAPNLTVAETFNVTVNGVNDTPTISTIADQTINEDTATVPLAFTIADIDSVVNCATSVTVSSSNTTIIPTVNVVVAGTAPNCTVTVMPAANENGGPVQITLTLTDSGTPAPNISVNSVFNVTVTPVNDAPVISAIAAQSTNEDTAHPVTFTISDVDSPLNCSTSMTKSSSNTTLIPLTNMVLSGTAPNCTVTITPAPDANGTADLTLTVSDGSLTAISTFTQTVTPQNDAPVIAAITAQSTNEDTTISVNFTINDLDNFLGCTTSMTASSSNTTLVPVANVVFSGTAPNCTATITPAVDQNGTVNLTFTVSDGSLTDAEAFTLTVNAVNDAPVISAVGAQSTNEDTTIPVNFTITDVDTVLGCTSSMTASSSNTALVPMANVVFSGTAPNCTATITPAANQNGSVNLTFILNDGSQSATSSFTLTVSAINDAPVISVIANQSTNEDTASPVTFTITDIDSVLDCTTSVSAASSNTTVVPGANIVFSGIAPNCTGTVTPGLNQFGSSDLTFTVTDGSLTDAKTFTFAVISVNDTPTISTLANQTINEDSATAALAFTINDVEDALNCSTSITISSSNTTIIPNTNIVLAGTAPNCTVTVTPAANQNGGPVQITLTVADGSALTAQSTFNISVNPINDAPTISAIADQSTPEDTATGALAFTINDVDSALDCSSSMTATSSNTAIIPNANIVFGGTAPNCIVTVTPAAGQNGGPTQITLTVTDAGTPAPNLSAQSTFAVTVDAINDAPSISVVGNQTINEDVATAALPFTINDSDSTLNCSTSVSVASSNTTIIPTANAVIGGTAPNCTVTVTPAANQNGGPVQITLTLTDSGTPAPNLTAQSTFNVTVNAVNDAPVISSIVNQTISENTNTGALAFTISDVESAVDCSSSMTASSSNTTIIPTANIVFGGTAPNCTVTVTPAAGQNGGPVQITLMVTDTGLPMPALTSLSTFNVTVTPVNDAPTITPIANTSVNEDSAVVVTFDINDQDSTLLCTSANLSATSTNTSLVPVTNVVFGGTYPNCTATATPVANANGTTNITVTVMDNGTPNLQALQTFTLTVNAVNDVPSISVIANQTINEDVATAALAFTITDVDSTVDCSTSVTASSSNTAVIPNANIVIGGTAPNCTVTVTPAAEQSGGPVQITLILTDSGTPAPNLTAQSIFNVTVNAVNDTPVISAIANQTISEDGATAALAFTITDVDSTVDCSTSVTASSSNTTIIPNANIAFGGTAPNCTVTVTPAPGQNGSPVQITLMLTDAGTPMPAMVAQSIFNVTVNAVNDAPTISTVADQTTNEDTATAALAFTVADSDSTLNCNTSVTASSSNTTIIPTANVVIGGTAPNCTVTVTPAAHQNGGPVQITLTLTDSGTPAPNLTAQSTFNVTVNPVNDVPTISTLADQSVNEDGATAALSLTINDVDSTLNCSTSLTASSSNTAVIPNANIVFGGTAPNCTVTVTPAAGQSGGPVQITLTVTDSGTPAPNLAAQSTFNVTVNAVNDAPVISAIADQVINEDTNTGALNFTITDVDNTLNCSSSMTASSSNTTIIPNANIVFGGTAPNCTVTVTPAPNQNGGPVQITVSVADGGSPNLTVQEVFTVTVGPINDVPTISAIANQTVNEDTATAALAFTINDVDSSLNCSSSMTASSSNTTIIPTANIVFGGTAPNCTVTVTPAANQNGGLVQISLTVTDSGAPAPNLSAQTTFNIIVNAVNDAPTISTIADQTINEDSNTGALAFTIADTDSTIDCATNVSASSSNTTVIPTANVVIGGTAPNCTVTVTPAANQNGGPIQVTLTLTDAGTPAPNISVQSVFNVTVNAVNDSPTISTIANQTINEDTNTGALAFTINDIDSTLSCATNVSASSSNTTVIPTANVVIGGTAPNCTVTVTPAAHQNGGPVQITLTLTDSGTPAPNLTAASMFNVTVNAVNDAPVISAIANQTINEDGPTGALAFTITDIDSTLDCSSSMTASSSNTTLVPNANIVFGGTAPNCTVTVTPAASMFGTADIILTVTDAGTPAPNLTASRTFTLTVNPVNDAPTITPIADQTINEDSNVVVNFNISDIDDVLVCTSANLTASSSNTSLVPNANIVFGGAYPNCTATITPSANADGLANITITVLDNGTPNLQASRTFALTVNPVNDAPTISAIANQTINEDTATAALAFTINDIDSTMGCNTAVTVASSNTTIVPNANIMIGGTAPNCTVTVSPAANQNGGPVQITLTLTDSGTPAPNLTAQSTFNVTVTAVNDAPIISAIANQTINEDTPTAALAFTITDIDSTLDCSSSMTASSSNTTLVPNANIVFGGTAPNCTVTVTPAANQNGGPVNITLTLTDAGTPAPNIAVNTQFTVTVNAVNDAPTISAIANQTVNEDTATAALAFTINDSDSTLNCATSITASSSNTTMIPTANIVFGGTAPNCTVTVTPAAHQNGGPVNITLTLTDSGTGSPGVLTAQSSFQLTVNAINDVPTISTVANQTISEDGTTGALVLTINDVDSTLDCSTSLTASSSNTAVIPNANIVFGGTAPNCTVTVTPAANQNGGPTQITLTVTDAGTPAPNLTAASMFNVTVNAVNDAPVISTIANQTINEDANTGALAFTITDIDSAVDCTAGMTTSSSNTTIIPTANIVFGGTAPNCTVTVTPAPHQNGGPVNITLTLTDTGTGSPGVLTAQSQFTVTVNAINDAPVISAVADQTINEDSATAALAFTITDVDSTLNCGSSMTVSSSNTTIIPNANIVIGGTAPNCMVTVTPAANQNGGPVQITLMVTDSGSPVPNLTTQSVFNVAVNGVNDAPVISTIANQTINEDANTGALAFTISDVDSTIDCSTSLTASSSNTTIIPNANIVFSGVAPNCTVTVTPAANQNGGPVQITVMLTDSGTPAPNLTAQTTFNVTVNAVNDAPVISTVADQTINEDTPTAALAFTITDVDSTLNCMTGVTVSSSNTTIIPNANVVIGGTAPNCTVTVTPAANQNGGPVNITLTLTDSGTGTPGNLTVQSSFALTISAVNDTPILAVIGAQSENEDTNEVINFTMTDVDSILNCTTSLTASSSNTTLIANASIVFSGTAPNCTATLTPTADQNGTADITFTVIDSGTPMPALTASRVFTQTIVPVNDAPTMAAIGNQTINEDANSAVPFVIGDIDSTLLCTSANLSAASTNTSLVPVANIVFGGTYPNCTATVTPVANGNGSTDITLTVFDNGSPNLQATRTFTFAVNAVNDVPTISTVANQTINEDTPSAALAFTITDIDSTLNCTTGVTATSSNTTIIPNANVVISGVAPNCTVTVTPALNQNGGPTQITLSVIDTGTGTPGLLTSASTFNVTVNAVNDAPVISTVADQTINEDTPSAALAFTITDVDSTLNCATGVTATSSNTTIIPNANVVIGGTAPNCTVTVTPAANQNGGPTQISLTVIDTGTGAGGLLTAQSTFNVTVSAVNDVPTISTVADQSINEDANTGTLALIVGDVDSTLNCATSLTASSSNTTIIPNANIVFSGVAPNCTVTVTPAANQNGGPVQITVMLTDSGTPAPNLTAQTTFNVTVNAVNDAPVISTVADQTINEDTPTAALAFTITDVDSTLNCMTGVTVSSSNTTIIPNANVVIGGTAPNCTVTVTPAANQNGGPTQISLTVIDTGTGAGGLLTAQSTFNVTVSAVNDVPIISAVANQTLNEDGNTGALALTITDSDSTLNCATSLTASSSNTTIIPNANIVIGGTAPNCTVTVTPAANQNGGPTQITVIVTDSGTGSPGVLTAQSTFDVTVTAVNDAPIIATVANQTINEDTPTAALAFTITDVDSTLNCATGVTATSSNTTIIPNANVVIGGTAPNCTVTVTPAANQNGGPTQISLTVIDTGTGTGGLLTAQSTFNVTVNAVNDAPVISTVANQTISEDANTGALAFTITDLESTLNCATGVTVSSSNTTIIPNANIVIGGIAPNCTVTVTPAANQNGGPTQISLIVADTGTPGVATAQSIFNVTVSAVNDAPVISAIAAQSTNEDTPVNVNFTISDLDATLACSAANLTASSSNTTIVPNANITFSGTAPNCVATISPALNENGATFDISITVTDNGNTGSGGALNAQSSFSLTVNAVNDAPIISAITNGTTNSDTAVPFTFTISDVDAALACTSANLTASSSDTTMIPVANIVFSGVAPNCTATVTPVTDQNGQTQLTITVSDNGVTGLGGTLTNSSVFTVTVRPKAPTNVTLGASWTQTTSTPLISWTASTSANKTDYEVGISTAVGGGNATAGWTSIGGIATSYTHASVGFAECGTYYASVRTKDSAGTYSPDFGVTVASFRYDGTDPVAPSALTIIGNAKTDRALNLSWTAGSDNCSFLGYDISIGTSAGGQQVLGWTAIGNVTSYQRTGLALTAATNYYFNIRSRDDSGRTSSVVTMGPWNICAQANTAISGAYTVPVGCYYARAKVWGGGGGRGNSGSRNGGGAGYVGADFSVKPGEGLTVNIGGVGSPAPGGGGNAAGGANGGGSGKGAAASDSGGGGGGRTEILRAGVAILIASGGGGGGNASVGGAGCDGTSGGGAAGIGSNGVSNGGGGGGGGLAGGSTATTTGGRGGTCEASYAGGPTGQFGSFNGLLTPLILGGSGVNPGNSGDANRAGAGRGQSATAGTGGRVYMIWP